MNRALSLWLQGFMWICAAAAAISIVISIRVSMAFEAYTDSSRAVTSAETRSWKDAESAWGAMLGWTFLLWTAMFVVLLVWMSHAHRATESLGPGLRKWSSGWTVGAWFIPLAQFVLPKLVFNEIERIAASPRPDGRVDPQWRQQPTSALGWTWWVAFVVAYIAGYLMLSIGFAWDVEPAADDDYRGVYGISIAASAALAIASVAGALYIRRLSQLLGPNSPAERTDDTSRSARPKPEWSRPGAGDRR